MKLRTAITTIFLLFFTAKILASPATGTIYFRNEATNSSVPDPGFMGVSLIKDKMPEKYEGPSSSGYHYNSTDTYSMYGDDFHVTFEFNADEYWYTMICTIDVTKKPNESFIKYTVKNGPYLDWAKQQCNVEQKDNDLFLTITNFNPPK